MKCKSVDDKNTCRSAGIFVIDEGAVDFVWACVVRVGIQKT